MGEASFQLLSRNPYADNIQHLEALEIEAMLMLAVAHFRLKGDGEPLDIAATGIQVASTAEAESVLEGRRALRLEREAATKGCSIELGFARFREAYALTEIEQRVALLLYMTVFSSAFKAFRVRTLFGSDPYAAEWGEETITPPTLLAIVSGNLREEVENRKVFSVDATLDREGLIVRPPIRGDYMPLRLNRHLVRLITGDHNVYEQRYEGILREKPSIDPSRVVLPGNLKEELLDAVLDHAGFLRSDKAGEADAFFGYGTGLVLFFHGPSGTGKTMTAHAIASLLGKEIFTLDLSEVEAECDIGGTLRYLYREARFSDGIVFFDECDDVFTEGTPFSRQLLIEIERSKVVTILATNRPRVLDPAMERRISRIAHFPLPGPETREALWQALLPPFASYADQVSLAALGRDYPLSGGHIKNAILSAIREATRASENFGSAPGDLVVLDEAVLRRAAATQAHRSLDENGPGVTFFPEHSFEDLRIGEKGQGRVRNLARIAREARDRGEGLNLYIATNEPSVGVTVAGAIARACDLWVRVTPVSDTLTLENEKYRDPERQVPLNALAYLFCSAHWDKTVTVLTGIQETDEDETAGVSVGQLGFLTQHLTRSRGINILVGPLPGKGHIPEGINYVLPLDPPSPDKQIEYWRRLLDIATDSDDETRILRVVARHSLHFGRIESIHCLAETIAQVDGEEKATVAHVEEAISRYCSHGMPVGPLFGAHNNTSPVHNYGSIRPDEGRRGGGWK